jgi:hypothetical protein
MTLMVKVCVGDVDGVGEVGDDDGDDDGAEDVGEMGDVEDVVM